MPDQTERLTEAYDVLANSDEHDYQRVTFEFPAPNGGQPYRQHTGYVAEATVSGEAALKFVPTDDSTTIPFNRVLYVETVEEPANE